MILKNTQKDPYGMVPARCLTLCKNFAKRFALVHSGDVCSCLESMPLEHLMPLPKGDCEKACSGDPFQFCGGMSEELLIFTAECEPGWTRFSGNCYHVLDDSLASIRNVEQQDICGLMGGDLFMPKTFDDLEFVILLVSSISHIQHISLGIREITTNGILASDNSYLLGMDFISLKHDQLVLDAQSPAYYSMETNDLHLDTFLSAIGVCQKPIGMFMHQQDIL